MAGADVKLADNTYAEEEREKNEGADLVPADVPIIKAAAVLILPLEPVFHELYLPGLHSFFLKQHPWKLMLALRQLIRRLNSFNLIDIRPFHPLHGRCFPLLANHSSLACHRSELSRYQHGVIKL